MLAKHRTPAEQRVWDEIVIALAPVCAVDMVGAQGCAHLIREIADEIIRERRQSIQEDR